MTDTQVSNIAASIFLSKVDEIPLHSHETYELLLMLSGEMNVLIGNSSFKVKTGDVLLINALTLHGYRHLSECIHIVCQLNIRQLLHEPSSILPVFRLNSASEPGKDYHDIRSLIIKLVDAQSLNDENTLSTGIVYEILSYLMLNHQEENRRQKPVSSGRYADRQAELLEYISSNYRSCLTLNSLADRFKLSVPYLSSFFRKHLGMTFTEYYNAIRLDRATNEMLMQDDSIETIAQNNGFSDARYFVKLFKNKYHTLPSAYRKIAKGPMPFERTSVQSGNLFHPSLPKTIYAPLMEPYRQAYITAPSIKPNKTEAAFSKEINCGTFRMADAYPERRNDLLKYCFVQNYNDLLRSNIREMLVDLQKRASFDGISFDIMSYFEDFHGNSNVLANTSDYYLMDQILDFLISINLKPLFTIRIDCIDAHDGENSSGSRQILNIPNDTSEITAYLRNFSQHIIQRYGISTAMSWHYRVWFSRFQEDTPITNQTIFFEFYRSIFKTIKTVSPNLRIGSHALFFGIGYESDIEMNTAFINFCRSNNCMPDYFNFAFSEQQFQNTDGKIRIHTDHFYNGKNVYDEIEAFRTKNKVSYIPFHLFEHNTLISNENPINDTCFKSCYLMHIIIDCINRSNMVGFWKLTDLTGHHMLSARASLFHGGTALYTYNGIAKPYFYIFPLINKLGRECLAVNNGYAITRDLDKKRIAIIFYSYNTTPFMKHENRNYILKFDGINGKSYCMKQYSISETHGSAYNTWKQLGSPVSISDSDMDFIASSSSELAAEFDIINNGIINLQVSIAPLEIRMIEIEIFNN